MGGIPERDASGDITKDKIHYETIIYDNPGEYQLLIYGKWFARKTGSYSIDVSIDKLSSRLMKSLQMAKEKQEAFSGNAIDQHHGEEIQFF